LAGISQPQIWQGLSLNSKLLSKRKEMLFEHLWQTPIIPPSEAIRTERWKYLRYINDKDHEELYDLQVDPLEINNLIADPKHQKLISQLRRKLEDKVAGYLKDSIE
ncbi:MAG: DUF4976 domain-containing protein, partial [Algoriphagus sp.]